MWESSEYFANGEIPGPLGSAHRVNAPYQALRTKDGYINIGAASQPTWEQFCRAIGQDALIEDERYLEPNDRKARETELAELLEGILSEHTTAHWMEQLEAAGVVAGPIYDMEQVYSDDQVLAREMKVTTGRSPAGRAEPHRSSYQAVGNTGQHPAPRSGIGSAQPGDPR